MPVSNWSSRARIGYLASHYPAPSHTFIRREIAALRGEGLEILTYSIRVGEAAENDEELSATFAVLAQAIPSFIAAHFVGLARNPIRYFATLRLALQHRVPGLKAFVWSALHFGEAVLLARQLRRDGVTHLHNHFANSAATVGMLASYFDRIPWSLTLHGISEFDYPAGLLLAKKLEHAQFASCVSYFGKAQAMRLTRPEIWPKLSMVRCAIDPHDLPPSAIDCVSDKLRLICVARLSPEKGHAGLIDVVQKLAGEGHIFQLELVGDGPERHDLESRVRKAGLGDRIQFLGALSERAALDRISQSQLLVLPSFMEGLPVVLIEALAIGVPVVASRVAGIPELVTDGETGLLFDPGNWEDLHRALTRMITDPTLRSRAGGAGKVRALSEFSYPAAALPLIPLFDLPSLPSEDVAA